MSITVAIIGEKWESVFAWATLNSISEWLPTGGEVILPAELKESADAQKSPFPVRFFDRPDGNFQSYDEARQQIINQENTARRGLLLLAAGVLPAKADPLRRLGNYYCEKRVVEWFPPENADDVPSELYFETPVHQPPVEAHHKVEHFGRLDFWTIDCCKNYFQSLKKLPEIKSPLVWSQYGPQRTIFVYNTNEFDEESSIEPYDDYFILASGLLGLKMIVESQPSLGSRIIVYDINPDQLKWTRFILERAGTVSDFESLIGEFSSFAPSVSIREPLSHELVNAKRQSDWYRKNHRRLAELVSLLEWKFIECDLWTNPTILLNNINPSKKNFFMYLDLFIVWNINSQTGWVENYADIAASLEALILARAGQDVTFLPGHRSEVFQLHPASPFAERRKL